MSYAKLVNIARLMTTYNFQIEELPNNLKCARCKFVLKDACQVPCGCRFCRSCIDDMISRGDEFCPGVSEDCGESLLSRFQSHYGANKRVSRLAVKCPIIGCVHECQLADMEEHLRDCPKKSEECPFRELGCTQDKLAAEEICGHLQQENRSHSEILIWMIANINREIDELKKENDVSSRDIELLKHELLLKDGQIRSIMDQMVHVQNENKSIKNEIKSIKEEKDDLATRVSILSERMEREIVERRKNDKLVSTSRVIEHMDRELAMVKGLIGSNKDELATEMQSVRGGIGSINQDVQSLKNDICSLKSHMQSIQMLVGLGQFDARFEWLINIDVEKMMWLVGSHSEYFSGEVHPYKYRLTSWNYHIGTATLYIQLQIYAGPNDEKLAWPFKARVVITVTDLDRAEVCKSISLKCRIEKPPDNDFGRSDTFKFLHTELIKAGLNLSRGARVSCVIVLNAS